MNSAGTIVVRFARLAIAPRSARFADQATAALINFVLTAVIVRVAGVEGLGEFNLPLTIYLGAVALQRAVIGEPLLASRDASEVYPGAVKLSALGTVVGGAVVVLVGAITAAPAMIVLGIALPSLLLEDLVRYAHFRDERPRRALLMDVIWLAASASILLLPIHSAAGAVAVWGAGAFVATVVGWAVGERPPWRRGDLASFLQAARGISGATAVDITLYLYGWSLPVALGLEAVSARLAGEYRIASTLMSPLGIVASTWTIGTYSRVRAGRRREDVPILGSAATVFAISLVYAALCVLLHTFLATVLFGHAGAVDTAVMALVALQIPLYAFEGQLAVWFKLTRVARYIAISRVLSSSVMAAMLIGAAVAHQPLLIVGAIGASAAAHSAISLGFYLHRRRDTQSPGPPGTVSEDTLPADPSGG